MTKTPQEIYKRLSSAAINLFESPWSAAIISGFIYMIVSAYTGFLFQSSQQPYYNYLADAFLHGQSWLRQIPNSIVDLSILDGRYYLYWAPFPAILIMPLVAIFGVQLNDVLYTIVFAAINVGLIAHLLRAACNKELLHLTKTQRAILVFFFAFGTVHFTLAPFGSVWFTGQIIGFTCIILAYIAALALKGGKAWFFTGLALACAMLTRNTMVFTGIFPFVYIFVQQEDIKWKSFVRNIAWGILPLCIALAFYLFYNQVRFDNPMETGLAYHNVSDFFRDDFERYGVFNINYIPTNIYYQYIFYPFPLRPESIMGGSLFLLSPIFFGVFPSLWKPRNKFYVGALLASILVTNIPIILLMGTGYWQIGPRYTLDFTVPLLLLTAMGIEKWNSAILLLLTFISTIHYIWGVKALSLIK